MQIVASRYRSLFLTLFATFILFGTTSTVVGAALPTILEQFHWSYGVAGILMAAGSLGSFLAMYIVGHVIDKLGARAILAFGFAMETLSLLFFGATPSPVLNTVLYFLVGVGQACLEAGVNWVCFRIDEEGGGRPMNIMHGAFSIGAVVGPFIVGMLLKSSVSWAILYRAIAILYVGLLVVVFFVPLQRLPKAEKAKASSAPKRKSVLPYIGFIALLFYVGTELGLSNWSAEYFVRVFGYDAAAASFTVSVFWGGLALGRFGFPVFLKRARPDGLLVALSCLLAAAIIALALLGSGGPAAAPLALVAVALAGLGASCVYPSVITLVGRASPENPGTAIGLAAAGGSFGSFAFPFLMSAIATAKGVQAGFAFYALMALVSLGSALALVSALRRAIATSR
jgi:fucose permease